MSVSINDLLATPHFRTTTLSVEGLGKVTVRELPPAVVDALRMRLVDDDDAVSNEDHARFALQVLGMASEAIKKKDMTALLANVGQDVISQLCNAGLDFRSVLLTEDAAPKKS